MAEVRRIPKGNSKFALKNETYNVELGSDMSNVIANEIVTGDGGLIAAAKNKCR